MGAQPAGGDSGAQPRLPEPPAAAGASAGPFATGGPLRPPTPGTPFPARGSGPGGLRGPASSRDRPVRRGRRGPGRRPRALGAGRSAAAGSPRIPPRRRACVCGGGSPGSAWGSARGRELLSGNSSVGQRRAPRGGRRRESVRRRARVKGITFLPLLFPPLPPPFPPWLFWIKLWRRKEPEVNASAQFSCEEEAGAAARSRGGGSSR